MMRWILVSLGMVVGLIVVTAIVGALLPRDHRASSSLTLRQPPEAIWIVISDPAGVPGWWPDVTTSSQLPVAEGGRARWQQTTSDGYAMVLEVEQADPPRLLKTVIVTKPGDPFGGTWTYQLSPADSGTTLTITEEGWVANPLFRVMMRLMGTHRTLDSYLAALAHRFGESAPTVHVD
jgi:uncharacterized protein YndB with AHSA1/START domain